MRIFGGFFGLVIFEQQTNIEVMRSVHGTKAGEFIQTYVRLKPVAIDELSAINASKHEVRVNRSANDHYEYNEVFGDECKNGYIFETVMMPVVQHIFQGFNACILAYGQTSSGKTYTMKGVEGNLGLIPLTTRQIFDRIRRDSMVARVSISYFQIYNENIIDLLSRDNVSKYLEIRDDIKKNTIIQDLIEAEVKNEDESLTFFEQGEARRKFACNNVNFTSSRSHTIFRINLEVAHQNLTTSISTISLVDLAGSQSISKTNAVGLLKKESENINKSLLALSIVIRALSEKNSYINFRDSRLTRILQPCLIGRAKTVVICTVNQTEDCLPQTINTLKFGVAANSIKTAAQKNILTTTITPERPLQNDPKYDQLYQLLMDQRKQKEYLVSQNIKLKNEIDRYRVVESRTLAQIFELKHKLLAEESQNVSNNLLLNQLKNQKERTEDGSILGGLTEDVRTYKSEIAKLEIVIGEMRESNEQLKKARDQLQKNERTLLDKLAKYQRQLSALQNTLNQQKEQQTASMASLSIGSLGKNGPLFSKSAKKEAEPKRCKVVDNPYTIGKVIELSTKILEMKLQLNEYIKYNAALQQQNQKLNAKLQLFQRNFGNEEDQVTNQSKGSIKSRLSGKVNEHEFKSLKEENKRLNAEKVALNRKIAQMRVTLKKNSNNYIEQLEGFNRFLDNNFTDKEREKFQFLLGEDPQDYDPLTRPQD